MKKYTALLLALLMLLTACGSMQEPIDGQPTGSEATETGTTEATRSDPANTTEVAEPATVAPTTEPTVPATTEPATEATTEPTEPVTTEPATEATTAPTEPVTTEPATEATTAPTEPAATEPTTKPTEPATEPTTAPTEPPTTPPTEPTPNQVTLKLNTDGLEMYVGDTATIKATYSGASGEPTWSSSNESVVTVKDGKVTAHKAGEAVITASYGGKNVQCMVWVDAKAEETTPELGPAVSIGFSGNNGPWDYGIAGNSLSFHAYAKTADGQNRVVTATSSNTGVATVSCSMIGSFGNIKVSFKSAGSTIITVTSDDGKMYKELKITVKGGYSCNPGGGQLTPEQYAAAATGVLVENGLTSAVAGAYTVLTLSASDLTWSSARAQGETLAHRGWSNGCSRGSVTYEGTNEDGNYVFHLRLG